MATIAGWGRHARDASYVAMAESSGDAGIVNSIGATGLMQINQPVHVKAHPTWTVRWLQNPINNLRAAKILFDEAGRWDGPWLDSRDKGGGGGWGQHVKGGGATQVDDNPCDLLPEGPARDWCERDDGSDGGAPDTGTPLDDVADTAEQISRIAQAIAKGANWIADPGNWVRVVYVVGGGVLTVAAVNVIARPAIAPTVQAVGQVLPTKTYRRVRARRANQKAAATP